MYKETFSWFTPLGPSLEEKLFSSCDLTADKMAQISFKSKQSLDKMGPVAKVSTQFQSSSKSRNWAVAPQDLSSVFVIEKQPGAPVSAPIVPPSAADSSLPTGSDSGERRACLLDYIAASSLPCFAAALTHRPVNAVVFSPSWRNIFALNLIQLLHLILLFGSICFFSLLGILLWQNTRC